MNRLEKYYENVIRFDLLFKDHYINIMQIPQLSHITLNTGIGLKAILEKKQILTALLSIELISEQRPLITRAKKSIDKFKLREKMPIGCKVTLRKSNLYEFMDRITNIIIPFMDNSNDLFNSLYFKKFTLAQEEAQKQFRVRSLDNSKLPYLIEFLEQINSSSTKNTDNTDFASLGKLTYKQNLSPYFK
jgi:hypothetical protein